MESLAIVKLCPRPPFRHGHQSGQTDLRLVLPDLQADCVVDVQPDPESNASKTKRVLKRFHMSSIMKMLFSWSSLDGILGQRFDVIVPDQHLDLGAEIFIETVDHNIGVLQKPQQSS